MDHHTVAAITIAGSGLDVLGSLYLAYDLLGGQHGPFRLLTRAVTYSVIFGVGYGLGLGLIFGVAAGVTSGITLAIEFNRAARGLRHYSLPWEVLFSAIRGRRFRCWTLPCGRSSICGGVRHPRHPGQSVAYLRGMRPAIDYAAHRRPRITRRQFWGTVVRTIGNLTAALICSSLVHHLDHPWLFAIRLGLVAGLVTGIGITVTPFIEYFADNLPQRYLGAFGILLILCGFTLQSFQYWVALFDVHLT